MAQQHQLDANFVCCLVLGRWDTLGLYQVPKSAGSKSGWNEFQIRRDITHFIDPTHGNICKPKQWAKIGYNTEMRGTTLFCDSMALYLVTPHSVNCHLINNPWEQILNNASWKTANTFLFIFEQKLYVQSSRYSKMKIFLKASIMCIQLFICFQSMSVECLEWSFKVGVGLAVIACIHLQLPSSIFI